MKAGIRASAGHLLNTIDGFTITGGRQTGSFAQSGGVSSFLVPAETGV